MLGCLRRLGCLVLLIAVACVLWITRDKWRAKVFGESAAPTVAWHPITSGGAEQARAAVSDLGRKSGPAYVTISAEQLGALLLSSAGSRLPAAVHDPKLAIADDRVLLQATIDLQDLRGLGDLGPLTALLDKREPFETRGTLDVVHPGLAEYRIESAKIAELEIPRPLIAKILSRYAGPERNTTGAADTAIPFPVPSYIGDVRVSRGRVTLYKNTQ